MTKLKNCPFCGGVAKVSYFGDYEWSVLCAKCEVETDDYYTEEEAIKQWNTRYDDWQPIETAPKDGSEILGYDKEHLETQVTYWRDFEWVDMESNYYSEKGYSFNPTHWKPLPQPPQESE